jgi:7-keto-8-aminopelargonate synthetase-like enzyme
LRTSFEGFAFSPNHLEKLERLLADAPGGAPDCHPESIFSMDGDAADLAGIAAEGEVSIVLCSMKRTAACLWPRWAGCAEKRFAIVDVSLVTFSKSCGVGARSARGVLAMFNQSRRAYMYSTAPRPHPSASMPPRS